MKGLASKECSHTCLVVLSEETLHVPREYSPSPKKTNVDCGIGIRGLAAHLIWFIQQYKHLQEMEHSEMHARK